MKARLAKSEDFSGVLQSEHIGIFRGVETSLISSLIESGDCQVITYRSGEDLFVQDQSTKHLPLYIVCRGGLFAVKHVYATEGEKRNTQIVAFDSTGTLIGEVEWLLRDVPHVLVPRGGRSDLTKATITAMTESSVLVIDGDARGAVLSDPVVARNLNRIFALKLLRRSARMDAMQKYRHKWHFVVASLFKRLVLEPEQGGMGVEERPAKAGPEWPKGYNRLRCQIRQADFADALGVSVVIIGRIFSKLEADKIAAYRKDGVIFVSDPSTWKFQPDITW